MNENSFTEHKVTFVLIKSFVISLQLYLRETIEHGPLPGQHCYKFAITKADKGIHPNTISQFTRLWY